MAAAPPLGTGFRSARTQSDHFQTCAPEEALQYGRKPTRLHYLRFLGDEMYVIPKETFRHEPSSQNWHGHY